MQQNVQRYAQFDAAHIHPLQFEEFQLHAMSGEISTHDHHQRSHGEETFGNNNRRAHVQHAMPILQRQSRQLIRLCYAHIHQPFGRGGAKQFRFGFDIQLRLSLLFHECRQMERSLPAFGGARNGRAIQMHSGRHILGQMFVGTSQEWPVPMRIPVQLQRLHEDVVRIVRSAKPLDHRA